MNDKLKSRKHAPFCEPADLNNSVHLQCFCLKPMRYFVIFRIMTPNPNLSVIWKNYCMNYLCNEKFFVALLLNCPMAVKCCVNGITTNNKL